MWFLRLLFDIYGRSKILTGFLWLSSLSLRQPATTRHTVTAVMLKDTIKGRIIDYYYYYYYLLFIIFFGCASHRGLWPPRFTRFLDHTQRRATVGRTPLDEWSARRRDLYLTTHTADKHPCPLWDSNPRPQQASGRRPTSLGPATDYRYCDKIRNYTPAYTLTFSGLHLKIPQ
jgi:hypothetical protein